ncbi:MAG: hypothetical protein HQM08_18790 [Candidatus Riflebacteria bacterium]|nr:hypothetical protein [Candidatus Riflebacteria bacterium]
MSKRSVFLLGILFLSLFVTVVAQATVSQAENDSVLCFSNDPQELNFADMNKLVELNKNYQLDHKTVDQNMVNDFFKHIQEHGIKNAGTGENQVRVAYVVKNYGVDVAGVVVLKGDFDQDGVLNILRKHYAEHSNEHSAAVIKNNKFAAAQGEKGASANPFQETTGVVAGVQAHIFPMPLLDREFITLSTGNTVLFSSAPRGKRELLEKTVAVVTGKLPMKTPATDSKIIMTFAPSQEDKKQIEQRAMARYDKQKADSLAQKKRLAKLGERIRQRVIRSKIQYVLDCIDQLQTGTMVIERSRSGDLSKTATVALCFNNADTAADAKKRIVKHLVKEIKNTASPKDKFALSNISVTSKGNYAYLRCQLKDASEQIHAFNLISIYVTDGVLERR